MIAVFGIPGSVHHRWRRFGGNERKAAEQWLAEQDDWTRNNCPFAWQQPTAILSEREARQHKWQNGKRIYETPEEEAELAEFNRI